MALDTRISKAIERNEDGSIRRLVDMMLDISDLMEAKVTTAASGQEGPAILNLEINRCQSVVVAQAPGS